MEQTTQPSGTGFSNGLYMKLPDGNYESLFDANGNPLFSGMASATVTLSSAQILALNTTPVTLVPAVAGKAIMVDSLIFTMNAGTTAYTGANNAIYTYTNGSGTTVAGATTSTILDATANTVARQSSFGVTGVLTTNAPVVISVGTANPAAGNGTATVVVNYQLV